MFKILLVFLFLPSVLLSNDLICQSSKDLEGHLGFSLTSEGLTLKSCETKQQICNFVEFEHLENHTFETSGSFIFNGSRSETLIFDGTFENAAYSIIGEGIAASQLPNGLWVGSLNDIESTSGYWVLFNNANEEILTGCKIDPATIYDLHYGQNLISYSLDYHGDIADVLPDDAEQYIVSIIGEGVAASKFGNLWVGSLSQLEPGKGYWVRATQDTSFQFNLQ